MDWVYVLNYFLSVGAIVLGSAFLLKLLGADFIWDMFSKVFSWIIDFVRTVLQIAPGPFKVLIFVLMFSLASQPIVNYTFGMSKECYGGEVYDVDLSEAMYLRYARSVGDLNLGSLDNYFYSNYTNSTNTTSSSYSAVGMLVPISDDDGEQSAINSNILKFVSGKAFLDTIIFDVCWDEDRSHNSNCYLALACDNFEQSVAHMVWELDKNGTVRLHRSYLAQKSKLLSEYCVSDPADVAITNVGASKPYGSNNTILVSKAIGMDRVCVSIETVKQDVKDIDCGYVNNVGFVKEELLVAVIDSEVNRIDVVPEFAVDKAKIANVLNGSQYVSEKGSLVTFTCATGILGSEQRLVPLVIGLPVFEPWFLFTCVFIGVLIYISDWSGRRYRKI
jgi:hypothetical protein